MTDSLVLAELFELLGGGVASTIPECAGAMFRLGPGYDLGAPDPQPSFVASLILDGERPVGRRASNRSPAIPLVIQVPSTGSETNDRATLAAAREMIVRAIDQDTFTLRWTREGGLPLVLDCFRASATVVDYSISQDRGLVSTMALAFQAAPYGRSDTPVTVDFPSPITGKAAPGSSVLIDSYSTVTGTHWSQSATGPGSNSAFWFTLTDGTGASAIYSRSGIGPFDLLGLDGLTVWAGFGSTNWFTFWGLRRAGPVQFTFTLSDGVHTASTHVTRRIRMSNNSYAPVWQKIRVALPVSGSLNLGAITGYTITASSRQSGDLRYADMYLDTFEAVAYATTASQQPVTGNLIDLAGIAGSARSPFSLEIQQPAGTTSQHTKVYSTPGDFLHLAAAGTTFLQRAEAYGAGGKGSTDSQHLFRAAGGGGEYHGEPGIPVTPGNTYPVHVPAGGSANSGTADSASFTGDGALVVLAHGGSNRPDDTAAAGPGGTGASAAQQLAGQQGNFDGGIGNWLSSGNATVAADSSQHQAGTGSLKLTSAASGDMTAGSCPGTSIATQGEPCDPLFPVTVNGFAKASATGRSCSVGAEFFDVNGVSLATLFGSDVSDVTTGFTAMAAAALTPPAGSVKCRARVRARATGAAGEVHWFDSLTLTSGLVSAGGQGGAGGSAGPFAGGGGGAGGPSGAGGNGGGFATGLGGTSGGGLAGAGGKAGGTPPAAGKTAGGGGGGAAAIFLTTPGGKGANGAVALTYSQTAGSKTIVVHRPGFDAPDTVSPYIPLNSGDTPDGTTEYQVPSLIPGQPGRFGGTYTVYLVNASWNNPSASRTLTVTVNHYEQQGGTVYVQSSSRTVTPNNLNSQLVNMGDLTIPDHQIPDDNTNAYFTITITSGNTSDSFQDVLFIDSLGSTVIIESPTAYVAYFIDAPSGLPDLGGVYGSMFDRGDAVSVLAYSTVSGPPMTVDPLGNQALLIYSADGSAPSAELTFYPAWILDRLS
ncbi:MAG TPA: hypothetical protein VIZ43_08605 [Trebonia sp.]